MNPITPWATLYEQLQMQLREQTALTQSPLLAAKSAIDTCSNVIRALKKSIAEYTFSSPAEEMKFFKNTKPAFYTEYIYYLLRYNLHLREPVGGKPHLTSYFEKEMKVLEQFFEDHTEFYRYYRSGRTDLDPLYFLRSALGQFQAEETCQLDPGFTTYGDYLISRIIAHDRLVNDINGWLLDPGQHIDKGAVTGTLSPLHWTASKTDLVELVYALQSAGVFNNGQASLKEIVALMESLFQQQLGNYYNTFNEMRLRKKQRLPLLEGMQKKLLERMEELDGR